MTRNTKIVYVYLALFAFVLGFSFTLASRTEAEPECCVVSMCPPPNEFDISQEGHWEKISGIFVCVQLNNDPCDWTYLCPDK